MYRLWHQVHSFVYSQVYLFLGFEERVCCLYANPHYFTRIKPSHRSTLTLNDIQFQIYFSRRMRSHSISMSLCWWLLYDLKRTYNIKYNNKSDMSVLHSQHLKGIGITCWTFETKTLSTVLKVFVVTVKALFNFKIHVI